MSDDVTLPFIKGFDELGECGAGTEFEYGLAICGLVSGHESPHFDEFEMYHWK